MRDGSHKEYVDYVTARIPALRRLAFLLAGDEHRADGSGCSATPPDRPPRPVTVVSRTAPYTIPGTPGWQVPAATAPTSCELERLTAPDGAPMALVSGADPTGRYIVGRSYPSGGYQAVIWHDGKGRKVMLPGDLRAAPSRPP